MVLRLLFADFDPAEFGIAAARTDSHEHLAVAKPKPSGSAN